MFKKTLLYLFLIITSSFFLIYCNKKEKSDVFADPVSMYVKVNIKDSTDLLAGAIIGLYSSESAYLTGLSNGNTSGADAYFNTINGELLVSGNAQTEYWMLVTYTDPVTFVKYSNQNLSSKIIKFTESTDVYFRVTIEPVSGNVSFWAQTGTTTVNVPITVTLSNSNSNIISTSRTDDLFMAYQDNSVASFSLEAGTYYYQASSLDGCKWTGTFTIATGGHNKIKLDNCPRAYVKVYLPGTSFNTVLFPFNVFVDNNKFASGTINASGGTASPCPSPVLSPIQGTDYLYLFFEPGTTTHTIIIKSSNPGTGGNFCTIPISVPSLTEGCNNITMPSGSCP